MAPQADGSSKSAIEYVHARVGTSAPVCHMYMHRKIQYYGLSEKQTPQATVARSTLRPTSTTTTRTTVELNYGCQFIFILGFLRVEHSST